jgi:multiple sugar transport system substrate-binding protein
MKRTATAAALVALALGVTACGGSGGSSSSSADLAVKGPIKIWLSNNPEELAWGKAMVADWNAKNPKEKVTAQEIPAGKSSEEVIGAAITAGNAPCLVFNTSPAAVPQFQKQGGLVALDDFPGGASYIKARTGATADQYKSPDGKFYQMPWKSNPVMIFYNKDLMKKAGVDPENPPLSTYDDFLATSDKIVSDGKSTFNDAAGKAVMNFWATMYQKGYAPKEKYAADSFADGKAAMAIVGPWAIAVYGDKVKWGAAPVPTSTGMSADQTHTFSDAKNVAIYSACKAKGTAWDVLKFATSKDEDGSLLDKTGQMPLRSDLASAFPDYFQAHPEYKEFASFASRTVEVPNVDNSIEIWQKFRDQYSSSVIFGKTSVDDALSTAASEIDKLAGQS